MGKPIQAVFERGVFRPLNPVDLSDGEQVVLSVQRASDGPREGDGQLAEWQRVYTGLNEEDIDEVERIALDRGHFASDSNPDTTE